MVFHFFFFLSMTTVIMISGMLLFLAAVIVGLMAHHAFTHDGIPFTMADFENVYQGMFSTHEGIMVFVSLLIAGMMLGAVA